MDNKYFESLDDMFNENSSLSDEGLKGFFDESLEFIQQLQEKLASPDEKTREEAICTVATYS